MSADQPGRYYSTRQRVLVITFDTPEQARRYDALMSDQPPPDVPGPNDPPEEPQPDE